MITIRRSKERGHFDHGWLDTNHTFSFADYYDEKHMGFRTLRVINEDRVAPGQGFGTHPHRDMEIITYVLEGALAHKDSSGGDGVLLPGEVQHMTAGAGIRHSEFNASKEKPVHFLQIWILPERNGLKPGYEQKRFEIDGLQLVASHDGRDGSLRMHQDADLFAGQLADGKEVKHALAKDRHAWIQVARGSLSVNGAALSAGDGAAVSDESSLAIRSKAPAEFLLFDLA
jgi:redox-sensitive bicupin YhaK (pirin superfamily)